MSSALDMVRQRRPTGPNYPVDKTWKDDIRSLMAKQGITQADLARQIGCKPSALTALFKPECKQSRLVPAIHRALGIGAPPAINAGERDEARQRLDRIWKELTPEQRELLLGVGAQMKRQD